MIIEKDSTVHRDEAVSSAFRRHVLIVDDDLDFAETIADILEASDYRIHMAHSIDEAEAAARDFPADVALLDIRLGSTESGISLIPTLSEIRPGLQCIMMTGYAAVETAIQAIKDGAYDYLRKPVSPDDLFATLDRCFATVELRRQKEAADLALQQQNRALDAVNHGLREVIEAAGRLTACRDYEVLGRLILDEFLHLTGAHGGSLFLVEPDRLVRWHTVDLEHVPAELGFPLREGSVFQRVCQSRNALMIEDVTREQATVRSGWPGYQNGSTLAFPILDHDQSIIALLSLHNKDKPPFTRRDQELGMVLASLCAEVFLSLQAAHRLQEEERRFREMADLLPAIVFELDAKGRFIFLSKTATELTGYTDAELTGAFASAELVVEEDRPRFRKNLHRLLDGHDPGNVDYRMRTKSGKIFQVLARSAPVFRGAEVIGARGFIFDISDRMEAERHRSQLAMAVDQAAEAIFILEVDGTIHYINPIYHFLTGIRTGERLGHTFQDILADEHNDDFFESVWETLEEGNVWAGRLHTLERDGTTYESEATISPLRNESGQIINYVAILRDISHETRLEKRLRQAEKLEAIGTLAGGIAHDFNNILSPIIGFTEIVREDLAHDAESYRNLEKVLHACHMARELVRRILTFSRRADAERKPVVLERVLEDALKLLRPSIPSTIEIRSDIRGGGGSVFADPTEIQQVILNLGTNAFQAMQETGGAMTIELESRTVDDSLTSQYPRLEIGREHLVLSVSDTGVGMDKATLDRIFDPFFSTKEMGKGTGLGLATVHGIVMEMGGDIIVSSEIGEGTTMEVFMPRYDVTEARRGEIVDDKIPRGSRERVLFVDDEEMILQLGEKMLSRLGYDVEIATGSEAALERFRRAPHEFEIVITDQTMPGMTGQDLAVRLRRIRSDIPIILITGFSSVLDMDRLDEMGIDQIVHKPFTRNDIGKAIRRALERA